jgi:ABC-type proline/glycine betaine transport system ATPase subunit
VAIHANRDILLMDEVLAVGDSNFQGKCLEEFNKYRDQGKTVILVSHDIATVQRYCNRSMLLRNGRIEMIGSPDEVGNKYIYQNMSDEEKRLIEEEAQIKLRENKQKNGQRMDQKEKIRLEKERRNRVAEITRVEYLDELGNQRNIFETGDNMSIRVYFNVFKIKEEFNFGIAIYNQENNYVLGINTIFDNFDTRKNIKDGYFQVDYRNIPLIENSYYIRASIVKDNFNLPYALMMKSKIFRVISKSKNQGIVNMDYTWR